MNANGVPNCTGSAACFSQLLVRTRPKLRLRSAQPSAPPSSRSLFRLRNAPRQPTQNIAGKKQARQEDEDFDYLLVKLIAACQISSKKLCQIIRKVTPEPVIWGI